MTDALYEYRREAEKQYSQAIVKFVALGKETIRAEELYSVLTASQKEALNRKLSPQYSNLEDVLSQTENINREVCHILLYYLQTAYFVRDQNMFLVGQAILENEQKRWNLDPTTAKAINTVVLRNQVDKPKAAEPQKWEQYYQLLFAAIQEDGILLKENTQAQLKLLQLQLEIPDSEVPAAKKLQSKRGVNYIPLWQLLKQDKWYAANEETRRCLVQAGGQQERDLQLIDVSRIDVVDLETIDGLWSEFSNRRFGFKAQHKIWAEIDPKLEDLEALGRKLDWRRNNSWISYESADFSKGAPLGHLPIFPHIGWWCWVGNLKAILEQFPIEDAKSVR